MSWSWSAWAISVVAVVISGTLAWAQGHFRRRPGLEMGFADHGGMWGDLLLLPIANAAIVPHLRPGMWIGWALAICALLSGWVHVHWYRGERRSTVHPSTRVRSLGASSLRSPAVHGPQSSVHSREHMWPARLHGAWWRDLSWAGWAHVVYVACELTVLIGFLLFPAPDTTIALVCLIFSLHVPLGLLQPRWFLSGELAGPRKQPLLAPLLAMLWVVSAMKSIA